jgi:hypothetical protein
MKKVIAATLWLFFLLPVAAGADPAAPWDGTSVGPKLKDGVYLINTPAQFAGFRDWIDDPGTHGDKNIATVRYKLTADINLDKRE